jgi:hypothetical protein
VGILQPTNLLLQPQDANNLQQPKTAAPAAVNVGTTWKNAGNINIDLDNLLGNSKGKSNTSSVPMNQMKNNQSPTHVPQMTSPISPTGGFPVFANNIPAFTQNPTSFVRPANQFNAFQ